MRLSYGGFQSLLNTSVVECGFTRRVLKDGWNPFRRMLCTLDRKLLLSLPGRMALNFTPPVFSPAYNAKQYNLIVVWDILWQDWRAIPFDAVEVISVLPTKTKKDVDKFWVYFANFLQNMTPSEKQTFMNK